MATLNSIIKENYYYFWSRDTLSGHGNAKYVSSDLQKYEVVDTYCETAYAHYRTHAVGIWGAESRLFTIAQQDG